MKRALVSFLCFVSVLAGFSGCSGESRTAAAYAETAPAQMETSQATETASQDQGAVAVTDEAEKPPLELDGGFQPEGGIRIAVVAKSSEGGYWKCMKKYMKEAVEYINTFYGLEGEEAVQLTFEGPDSEEKVDDQINTIDAVLAENPSVLCLAAIDMDSCQAQMETAEDNGIPVVLFDSKVTKGDDMVFCATDNLAAGAEAAQRLCAAMSGEKRAVIFADAAYSQAAKTRIKGFKDEIKENHADAGAECIFIGDDSTGDTVRDVLEDDRADGIFCTDQAVAEQVLSILKEYPEKEIAMVGFDAGRQQVQAIREGREIGTILQDVPDMARQTIQAALYAVSAIQPEEAKKDIKIAHIWVDSQDLEDIEQRGLLYD